jgi:hypothetical protein
MRTSPSVFATAWLFATVVVATLAVVGCGGESPSSPPSLPTLGQSLTPTPASSAPALGRKKSSVNGGLSLYPGTTGTLSVHCTDADNVGIPPAGSCPYFDAPFQWTVYYGSCCATVNPSVSYGDVQITISVPAAQPPGTFFGSVQMLELGAQPPGFEDEGSFYVTVLATPKPTPPPLPFAQRIYNSAQHDKGMNTKGLYSASQGNECVAALQKVLADAGLSQIANRTLAVATFQSALPNSGYVQVTQAAAVQGDIVILQDALGGLHVGIYEGNDMMLSNSSTPETFSWEDTVETEGTEAAKSDDGLPATTPLFFHHN